jgi:hypothetical protein
MHANIDKDTARERAEALMAQLNETLRYTQRDETEHRISLHRQVERCQQIISLASNTCDDHITLGGETCEWLF